tara:strand:- start:258 stop:1127 length:870 start_codon:yes stop_codon:yes gene_type:complete
MSSDSDNDLDNNNNDLDNNNNDQVPSIKQKRGRKKKIITEQVLEDTVKKKRGRKKKWEVETQHNFTHGQPIVFNESYNTSNIEIDDNYEQKYIQFGTLNIKVHSNKDNNNISDIKSTLINDQLNKNKLAFNYSENNNSDNEDVIINKIKNNIKILKKYENEFNIGNEIIASKYKCYNCHHYFDNKPFFLPIQYCPKLNRYKITGNFCSPNCVKAYAINSKLYSSKAYLVGQMYYQLLKIRIKPAPPIQILKEYGGTYTIDEYRQSFYNDKTYNLKLINTKAIFDEIIIN